MDELLGCGGQASLRGNASICLSSSTHPVFPPPLSSAPACLPTHQHQHQHHSLLQQTQWSEWKMTLAARTREYNGERRMRCSVQRVSVFVVSVWECDCVSEYDSLGWDGTEANMWRAQNV